MAKQNRTLYPCATCGKPVRRNLTGLCRPCYYTSIRLDRFAGRCRDCGAPCITRAARCLTCDQANRPAPLVTEDMRERMRAAARRRYAHVEERRQQAAALWPAIRNTAEIARILGCAAKRVEVYIRETGARRRQQRQEGRGE